MKDLKRPLFLLIAVCLSNCLFAQATFEKDFSPFLHEWSVKASGYIDQAFRAKLMIWGGGLLTLAAASMPFLENRTFKITSFVLTLVGAALTQYLVTFEVDPKMITTKAKIIQARVEIFEEKVKDADLHDQQIAKQLLFDRKVLEKELNKIDREIRGIPDESAFTSSAGNNKDFQVVSLKYTFQKSGCVVTSLNPNSGIFFVQGQQIDIPQSLSIKIKNDASNLYLSGSAIDNNLAGALQKTDSCIVNSLKSFLAEYGGQSKNEQVVTEGIVNLADELYKNYRKNSDGGYQTYKIVSVPKTIALGFYSDVHKNYEKRDYRFNQEKVNKLVTRQKVIKN